MNPEQLADCRGSWARTAWPPFGSLERVNRLKRQHGEDPLTAGQYAEAKAAYEKRHPSAKDRG